MAEQHSGPIVLTVSKMQIASSHECADGAALHEALTIFVLCDMSVCFIAQWD